MNFIEIFPFILIIIGLSINIVFGLLYKTNFIILMIKSIILIISLSACGIIISNTLKKSIIDNNELKKNKMHESGFEAHIPPITDEEFNNLSSEEDEFQEINPAALYKRNNDLKSK